VIGIFSNYDSLSRGIFSSNAEELNPLHCTAVCRSQINNHNPVQIVLDEISESRYHLYAAFGSQIAAKNGIMEGRPNTFTAI
jgi:hypothetical protein